MSLLLDYLPSMTRKTSFIKHLKLQCDRSIFISHRVNRISTSPCAGKVHRLRQYVVSMIGATKPDVKRKANRKRTIICTKNRSQKISSLTAIISDRHPCLLKTSPAGGAGPQNRFLFPGPESKPATFNLNEDKHNKNFFSD